MNGSADSLSRLPQPATEHDRSGSSRLTPVDDEAIYLARACGLLAPSTSVPDIGLIGLVPQSDSAVLGGFPLTSADFRDFCAHGLRMRIDDLCAPTGRSVARVSAFVGTGDDRLGRAPFWPAAADTFTPVFMVLSGATPPDLPPRAPTPPSEASAALPPTGRISTRMRRRTDAAVGAAQPAVDYGFGPGRLPRTSSSWVDPPPRVPRPQLPLAAAPSASRAPTPVPTVPIPSDRDRSEPLGVPPLGLSTPSESPSAPTADLDALGAAAEPHFGDSAARYSHTDWEREKRAELTCYAAIQYILLGRPLALPTELSAHFPSHQRPPFSEIQELVGKGRLHAIEEDIVLLARNPTSARYSLRPAGRAARLLGDEPVRMYVPLLMRPWIMQSLPFDCFLPSRHGTHTSHVRAFLLVDRNENMDPLVVATLLEVPSAEDTDGSMARPFDSPPSGAG